MGNVRMEQLKFHGQVGAGTHWPLQTYEHFHFWWELWPPQWERWPPLARKITKHSRLLHTLICTGSSNRKYWYIGQFGRLRAEMLSILHTWFVFVKFSDWCWSNVSLSFDALALILFVTLGSSLKWLYSGGVGTGVSSHSRCFCYFIVLCSSFPYLFCYVCRASLVRDFVLVACIRLVIHLCVMNALVFFRFFTLAPHSRSRLYITREIYITNKK